MLTVVLLALWLPATLHCDLEAAEITEALFGCHDHGSPVGDHHDDASDHEVTHSVDGLSYSPGSAPVKSLPSAVVQGCLRSSATPDTPTRPLRPVVVEAGTAPPEIARTWHFLTRAAPTPRAPSLLS